MAKLADQSPEEVNDLDFAGDDADVKAFEEEFSAPESQAVSEGKAEVPEGNTLPVEAVHDVAEPTPSAGIDLEGAEHNARPIPRISIQAFCEDPRTAEVVRAASNDRRLVKTHMTVHTGGISAAFAHYQESPTPNLIILESMLARNELLAQLDELASVCDPGTKVIIIGQMNDILLYRELLTRGVSEYLIAPIEPIQLMESISNLYNDPDSDPVGHIYAFMGTKGGCGSSVVCHNVSWAMSENLKTDVVVTDFDLPFGTAGLDFDQDPVQGIADALSAPDRLDEVLLDRLLTSCTEHLSLFSAPASLDRMVEFNGQGSETVLDVIRQSVPYVTVDIPHLWSDWSQSILLLADEIVLTATPDLASLRNTKNILDFLKDRRSNDKPPFIILNKVGIPKFPEIPAEEFAEALQVDLSAIIDFDAETFGLSANNGNMIEEIAPSSKSAEQFRELAFMITHRVQQKAEQESVLAPFLEKIPFLNKGA